MCVVVLSAPNYGRDPLSFFIPLFLVVIFVKNMTRQNPALRASSIDARTRTKSANTLAHFVPTSHVFKMRNKPRSFKLHMFDNNATTHCNAMNTVPCSSSSPGHVEQERHHHVAGKLLGNDSGGGGGCGGVFIVAQCTRIVSRSTD